MDFKDSKSALRNSEHSDIGDQSMDARRTAAAALLLWLMTASWAIAQRQFQAETTNFVVTAPDPRLANETARLAEEYRATLAQQWLGHTLPTWRQRCPIRVEIEPQAGGETTFSFTGPPGSSEPGAWQMRVFGSPERILDSVLPHEVTHTIFATHFRQPLPRWADEGACTTVEHVSERNKIQQLLVSYLTAKPSRGIPFNRMFPMRQYPPEMLPLYAQSYSVARYLLMQRGHHHFVNFVAAGLAAEPVHGPTRSWDLAIRDYYGYDDLSDLQLTWQAWVEQGSPDIAATVVAAAPNIVPVRMDNTTSNQTQVPGTVTSASSQNRSVFVAQLDGLPGDSWYRQQLSAVPGTSQSLHRIDSTIGAGAVEPVRPVPPVSQGTIWR